MQDYWRNFAFLGLTETLRVAGGHSLEVQQLTLRMYVQLCAVHSPFLVGGRVLPEHVGQFLWRISPEYETRAKNPNARSELLAKIARFPFRGAIRAVDRYLDRQFIDKPAVPVKRNDSKPDVSFAASLIHALSSNYGWTADQILDLPLAQIFQYLRRIRRENDPETLSFNALRDRLTSRVTRRLLAERKRQRQAMQSNGDKGQGFIGKRATKVR